MPLVCCQGKKGKRLEERSSCDDCGYLEKQTINLYKVVLFHLKLGYEQIENGKDESINENNCVFAVKTNIFMNVAVIFLVFNT